MASQDITMVDSGFWGGFDNGGYEGKAFENMLNVIDFPMESLESDCLIEDWDADYQCLGPIPPEELYHGQPLIPSVVGMDDGVMPPSVLKGGTSQMNQQPTFVDVSSTNIPLNSSNCDESGVFQATSPISVLENSSSSSAGKSIPVGGGETAIPVRSRSKRVRRPTHNPWFIMTPLTPSPKDSKPKKKKKKKLPQIRAPTKLDEISSHQKTTSLTKKCTHCEISKTPQWREGPMGPQTLCNACGVRYRSGRLFPEYRPAASPTFVPSLHSNSHRKVIEMRKKVISAEEETFDVKIESSMSLLPDFVSGYLVDQM